MFDISPMLIQSFSTFATANNSLKTDAKLDNIKSILRNKGYGRIGDERILKDAIKDPQLLKLAIEYFRENKLNNLN